MARTTHAPTSDYGAPAAQPNKLLRPLLTANNVLHFISSVIVMSIAAYFIANYNRNTHLVYWVSIAAIDTILSLAAIFLATRPNNKGWGAPLSWIFSYLWLTAFIFAAQDYEYGQCAVRSPMSFGKCSIKKTLEAFAFLAFLTNLIAAALETRLFDFNRNRAVVPHADHEKAVPVAPAAGGPTHTVV